MCLYLVDMLLSLVNNTAHVARGLVSVYDKLYLHNNSTDLLM